VVSSGLVFFFSYFWGLVAFFFDSVPGSFVPGFFAYRFCSVFCFWHFFFPGAGGLSIPFLPVPVLLRPFDGPSSPLCRDDPSWRGLPSGRRGLFRVPFRMVLPGPKGPSLTPSPSPQGFAAGPCLTIFFALCFGQTFPLDRTGLVGRLLRCLPNVRSPFLAAWPGCSFLVATFFFCRGLCSSQLFFSAVALIDPFGPGVKLSVFLTRRGLPFGAWHGFSPTRCLFSMAHPFPFDGCFTALTTPSPPPTGASPLFMEFCLTFFLPYEFVFRFGSSFSLFNTQGRSPCFFLRHRLRGVSFGLEAFFFFFR